MKVTCNVQLLWWLKLLVGQVHSLDTHTACVDVCPCGHRKSSTVGMSSVVVFKLSPESLMQVITSQTSVSSQPCCAHNVVQLVTATKISRFYKLQVAVVASSVHPDHAPFPFLWLKQQSL
jgi:hypothetical protein